MDPLMATVATTGLALVGTTSVAWRLRRRIRRVEAHATHLRRQLRVEQHAANHDPLTGLPNRRGFFRLAEALVADPARQPLVTVVLDVDDFKQVNDRLGHAAGDEALVLVARRFATWAAREPWLPANGPQPLVARLGGDEFAALLSAGTTDHRWWQHAAWQLTETLAAPMQVAGHEVALTGSVGLTVLDPQSFAKSDAYRPQASAPNPLAEALRNADAAMYRAKTGTHPTRVAAVGGDSPAAVSRARHQPLPDGRPDRHLVDATPTSGGQPR